jgi:hypothetical protein
LTGKAAVALVVAEVERSATRTLDPMDLDLRVRPRVWMDYDFRRVARGEVGQHRLPGYDSAERREPEWASPGQSVPAEIRVRNEIAYLATTRRHSC